MFLFMLNAMISTLSSVYDQNIQFLPKLGTMRPQFIN